MTTVQRLLVSCAIAGALVGSTTANQPAVERTFDADAAGAAPAGFSFSALRQPDPGAWRVRRQGGQGHLVHLSAADRKGYALAVVDTSSPANFVLSVRARMAGGARGGGLTWHYQDEQNFHAVLLDLTAGELSMYRFTRGNRVRLGFEDDLDLDPDAWHTLKVATDGTSVRVSLGGVHVFSDNDRRSGAEGGPGRAGLIATGDSEVWYDDLRIEARGHRK